MIEIVLGILLTFGTWLLAPDPIRRLFRRCVDRAFNRHPALAAEADIAMFGGRVELLTDDILSRKADDIRKQQFYEGAPLDWDVIASSGDVRRDQQDGLLAELTKPTNSLRFVCIYGEPGSGKSTLAWRVAAELHRRHKALVIRVKDTQSPDVWYQLAEFCSAIRRPSYVLADDIFRHAEVRRALRELSSWLPITILATSVTNEYRPNRLKGDVCSIKLGPPSLAEADRVGHSLGRDLDDLTPSQLKRLTSANEFLALMVEFTSGKGFQEVVRDSLENLFRSHPLVYRAYEYLCFAYTYSVAIPTETLERLDSLGRLHGLPNQEGAQGLIFYVEAMPGLVRPGHPRRAAMAWNEIEKRRSFGTILTELIDAVEGSSPIERTFIATLLRNIAAVKPQLLEPVLPRIQRKLALCSEQSTRISELVAWRSFYFALNRHGEAERFAEAAATTAPLSAIECHLTVALYRDLGRERNALPVLERWIAAHKEWTTVGSLYLHLVEQYGDHNHQLRAIDEAGEWLAIHPGDDSVRTGFLGLVERHGTPAQEELALQHTSQWLAKGGGNSFVRTAFMGLVERSGSADQLAALLQEMRSWLKAHDDDVSLRSGYLCTVERAGTPEQISRALEDTHAWFVSHRGDNFVRPAFLRLVESKGTKEMIARVTKETGDWLERHPEDNTVRTGYLGFVESTGTPQQIADILQQTSDWLAVHTDDTNVRTCYLGVVERHGTSDHIASVFRDLPDWLRAHPNATDVWTRFISSLCKRGEFDAARAFAEEAIVAHAADSILVQFYLRLAQDRFDEPETRLLYKSLMQSWPKNSAIKHEWARWLHDHHYFDEAETVFRALIVRYPRSFSHTYSYGKLLLDLERYGDAAAQFKAVLRIHRGHAMARDGLASALRAMARAEAEAGNRPEATRLFVAAEREFKSAIYWAGLANGHQAAHFTRLGWLYLDRHRWSDAHNAFDQAASEDPEYFGNYWGKGRAFVGQERWQDSINVLNTALEKAPADLGPPASDEIGELLALSQRNAT